MNSYKIIEYLSYKYGYKCNICGASFGDIRLLRDTSISNRRGNGAPTIDHILPKAIKYIIPDAHVFIESMDNKQLLCSICNSNKISNDKKIIKEYRILNDFVKKMRYFHSIKDNKDVSEIYCKNEISYLYRIIGNYGFDINKCMVYLRKILNNKDYNKIVEIINYYLNL